MKKILYAICAAALLLTVSCENLDLFPESEAALSENEVFSTYEGYHGFFLKCYLAMVCESQGSGHGDADLSGWDAGRSTFLRALYWSQEAPSDEMYNRSGSGYGLRNATAMNWEPGTQFPMWLYYRCYLIISYTNDLLRRTTESQLKDNGVYEACKNEVGYWRAEARFIRAYMYYLLMDNFGDVGFVDETSPNGAYPVQWARKDLYAWLTAELEEIQDDLMPASQRVWGRANAASAQFLLARIYLGCHVYAGTTTDYGKALEYCKKIIGSGAFSLAPNYIENFLADNNTSKEIIWGLASDTDHVNGSGSTNYLLKANLHSALIAPGTGLDFGITEQWGGNHCMRQVFVEKFAEEDRDFHYADPWGDRKKDHRALLFMGPETEGKLDGKNAALVKELYADEDPTSTTVKGSAPNGALYTKWRNVMKDRVVREPSKYSNVGFPVMRLADVYLMAAEAIMRGNGGTPNAEALGYVNEVRQRAYCSGKYLQADKHNADGDITLDQLTYRWLLDERSRELWSENWRRSDLIRFDCYTNNYSWDFKGYMPNAKGINYYGIADVDDKYNLYPIPQDDVRYNPNLKQNPNYE